MWVEKAVRCGVRCPRTSIPCSAVGRNCCSGGRFGAFHGFHASLVRFELVNFSPFRAIFSRAGERVRGQGLSGVASAVRKHRFRSRQRTGRCSGDGFDRFHEFHVILAWFKVVNFSPFPAIFRSGGKWIRGQRTVRSYSPNFRPRDGYRRFGRFCLALRCSRIFQASTGACPLSD
jgi:hypothetical protein